MEPKWHRHHQHGIIRLWYVCVRAHALRRPVGSTVKRAFGCLLLTIAEALLSPFRRVFWRWWRRNMEPKRPHHDHSIIRLRYVPGRASLARAREHFVKRIRLLATYLRAGPFVLHPHHFFHSGVYFAGGGKGGTWYQYGAVNITIWGNHSCGTCCLITPCSAEAHPATGRNMSNHR